MYVLEQQRDLLPRRQRAQGVAEQARQLGLLDLIDRLLAQLNIRVTRQRPAPAGPHVVVAGVDGDAIDPRPQPQVAALVGQLPVCLEEDLLRYVARIFPMLQDAQSQVIDRRLVKGDELLESLSLARAQPGHQRLVAAFDRDPCPGNSVACILPCCRHIPHHTNASRRPRLITEAELHSRR